MTAPTHLAAVRQHARALRDRGDAAHAKAVLDHAVEAGGAAYGTDHPEVLETARTLAELHRETGDLAAARRTLEEALAAGQLSLTEQHPLMVLLAYDLGVIADELGNRHEARRNFAAVARLGPAALGHEHPAVRAAVAFLDADETPPPPASAPPRGTAPPPAQPVRFVPVYPVPPAPAATTPGPAPVGYPNPGRRRTPLIVGLVIAGIVLATAATTAALLAARRPSTGGPPAATPSPTTTVATPPAGPGPTEVRLRDDGTSITLTWRDPSPGTVPFIVAGGRAGEQARSLANLPAGQSSHTLHGLNPRLEYCFTVVAVYSTESFSPSELVCTRRSSRNPQPTRS